MLEGSLLFSLFLALIWKSLTKYGNINLIFHSDIFLQLINVETDLWVKLFCHFPRKYNFLSIIQIWIKRHMDGCPFGFAFKSEFNSPT